jgi:hypothetical protein
LRAKGQIAREGRCVGVSSECAPIPVGHLQFCAARHWSRGKHCNRNYPTVFKQAQPWVGARGHQAAMQWKVVLFLPSPLAPSHPYLCTAGGSRRAAACCLCEFSASMGGGEDGAHTPEAHHLARRLKHLDELLLRRRVWNIPHKHRVAAVLLLPAGRGPRKRHPFHPAARR